jgi:hypothetical protein
VKTRRTCEFGRILPLQHGADRLHREISSEIANASEQPSNGEESAPENHVHTVVPLILHSR